MSVTSIGTPEALADWLATSPSDEARNYAFDSLIAELGHDPAVRMWSLAVRMNHGRELARIHARLDEGIRHRLPVVEALRAATGAVFQRGAQT